MFKLGEITEIDFQKLSLVMRKPVFRVSDQVLHKPGCTATEKKYRLEISDIGSKWIVLSIRVIWKVHSMAS